MTEIQKDLRSLDLCAIGLGQGGCNLAAEWRRRGYRTLVCNTARADLQSLSRSEDLDVPIDEQLFIGLEGHDGAGRDPTYGRACVKEHAERIREAVKEKLKGADALLIFAGLGGGTGSACDELVDQLLPLDIPMLCISTLPAHSESGITKVNAVQTANELVQRSLHGRVFIDNERLLQEHQDVGMGKFYPTVNAAALSSLDAINRMNGKEGWYSIKSFDGEDLRKVLLSGGVLNAHSTVVTGDISADTLVAAARFCVDGGDYFAQGSRLDGCPYVAVVITGPEKILGNFSAEAFDAAVAALKDTTGGGAVYEGIYISTDDDTVKVHVLSASLSLPERLTSLLAEAQTEGSELAEKISAELPTLETSMLEGMDLFRAPRRQPIDENKPMPPKPRPLSEQLRASFPAASTTGVAIMDGGAAPLGMRIALSKPVAKDESNLPTVAVEDEFDDDLGDLDDFDLSPEESFEGLLSSADGSPVQNAGGFAPRVGTGRYDENESVEATSLKGIPEEELSVTTPKAEKNLIDIIPRVGTGAYKEGDNEGLEPTQMLHESAFKAGNPFATGKEPSLLPPPLGDDGLGVDGQGIADAAGFSANMAMTNPVGEADIVAELPSRLADADEPTHAAPQNAVADQLLSSVLVHSGEDLLAVYEDLIERFRQAPDKRGRERVARRLVDDAKKSDIEVRALAVWAMNRLEQGGFKRALKKAAGDENAEIRRLAKDGLARLKSRKKAS